MNFSDSNRNVKDRFTINAYPSLVFISKGKFYEYKEKRDPESLISFAFEGFMALEGEDIPMEANFFRSVYKSLGKVSLQKIKIKQKIGDNYSTCSFINRANLMLYLYVYGKR